MKNNISIFCVNNIFKKEVAKMLATSLDMFYVDVNDLVKFELNDINKVINIAGVSYYDKIETKAVKSSALYENSVITLDIDTLNKGNNVETIKNNTLIVFLKYEFEKYKQILKKEKVNLKVNKMLLDEELFNMRNKLLENMADVVVNLNTIQKQLIIKVIHYEISKYYQKDK